MSNQAAAKPTKVRHWLFDMVAQAFLAKEQRTALQRSRKGVKNDAETGHDAATKYRLKHGLVIDGRRQTRTNNLRKLIRADRIERGLRPLCYGTPTKRERTVAKKLAKRAAA